MPSNVPPDESENWLLDALRRSHRAGLISEEWIDEQYRRMLRESPFRDFHRRNLAATIHRMHEILSLEEADILRKLYGLEAEKQWSIEELTHELHLSPAEIEDIERRALLKIKQHSRETHPRSLYVVKTKEEQK